MQTNNRLREALAGLMDVMHDMGIDEDTVAIAVESKHCHMHSKEHLDAIKKAKAALSEPVKNCEVGTPKEQNRRWDEACHKLQLNGNCCDKSCYRCAFDWLQMPYEEGGEK